uniref:zinc-ribbon domain-containing protein n=1 Tax=Candidatus Collinsella stercoripullorum TaxID=2838522 RepID=UPI0022DF7FD5
MYCGNCGAKNDDGNDFCIQCGANLKQFMAPGAPGAAPGPAQPSAPPGEDPGAGAPAPRRRGDP